MTQPVLLTEKSDGITTLTLNRPSQMNALSNDLKSALEEAFLALADDEETDVVILTGAGKAFCAGLDLKELADPNVPKGRINEVELLVKQLRQALNRGES